MKSKKRLVSVVALVISFIIVLAVAGCFNIISDAIVQWQLQEKLTLKRGSFAYKMWLKPPVPINFNIYVFNLNNPDKVARGEEPPNVTEKGPYSQTMHIHKEDIVFYENGTVSYIQPQAFRFNRKLSVGTMNDTFTTVNIPYITIANVFQHWPEPIQLLVNTMMEAEGEKPFKKLTINDILWGYKDPILELGYKLTKMFHISEPYLTGGKFGFFADKNNTGDGLYNVFTGANGNLKKYNEIDLWNKTRVQNIWKTKLANTIRGTDGSMHPPYITSDTKLKIFDAYLRRTLNLHYVKASSVKGLDTLRFVVPFSDFATASENPDNAGFCTPNTDFCMPSGCYNLSVASYGAPMSVSLPHFVGGDPYYQRLVHGMKPDKNKHQPFYDIHAITGVSIQGARKYQINMQTKSYPHFRQLKKFPLSYLPIIWIDGLTLIDNHDLSLFRDELQKLLNALPYIRSSLFGLAGVLVILTGFLVTYWYMKDKAVKETTESKIDKKSINQASESEKDPLLPENV